MTIHDLIGHFATMISASSCCKGVALTSMHPAGVYLPTPFAILSHRTSIQDVDTQPVSHAVVVVRLVSLAYNPNHAQELKQMEEHLLLLSAPYDVVQVTAADSKTGDKVVRLLELTFRLPYAGV